MHWRPLDVAVALDGEKTFTPVLPPDHLFTLPRSGSVGPEHNLAYAYSAFASAIHDGAPFAPDFTHALTRHRSIDAIVVHK
jgi:hypothetical protein